MRDPYLYPDSAVLKNLLDIRNSKKLQQAVNLYHTNGIIPFFIPAYQHIRPLLS